MFPTIDSAPAFDRWSLPALVDVLNALPGTLPPSSAARLSEQGWPEPERLPDDQLACMESTYWLVEDAENISLHDEWREGKGTWDKVGRHMRFQPGLVRVAGDYLRDVWALGWEEEIPNVSDAFTGRQICVASRPACPAIRFCGRVLADVQYMAIHMRRGGASHLTARARRGETE